MKTLFVLEYTYGNGKSIFVGLNRTVALKLEQALKFETLASAKEYLSSSTQLWNYVPRQYSFDENELEREVGR
jgi:hypothetical protein